MQLCHERHKTERKCLSPPAAGRALHTRYFKNTERGKDGDLPKGPLFVRHRQKSDVDFHCNKLLSI